MKKELTAERLRQLLHYDPETGIFRWLVRRGPAKEIAGARNAGGYRMIGVDQGRYYASRLAWLYVYGEWPSQQIDHIDRNRDNNRFMNLRLSTQSQNNANMGMPKHNTSGIKGVSLCSQTGRWRAQLQFKGKSISIGRYDSKIEALLARLAAERKHFGEFASPCIG